LQRINSDRIGDVLELGLAEIGHREIEPRFHLAIGVFGKTDRAALRSTMPFCTSTAQRTASTTLRNSTRAPSPVRFTTRPFVHGDGRIDQIAA